MLNRLFMIIGAKFSKLLGRAENPNETLDYSYEQMVAQLQDVKRGVADVATAKKRLELQVGSAQQNIDKLQDQARQAVAAGRDDLAKEALRRKAAAEQSLATLQTQFEGLKAQQDALVAAQHKAEDRIAGFRNEKEVIKAQYSAAQAQVKIGEAATGIGKGMHNTGLAVERAKDQVAQMQARAGAIDELTAIGALEDFTGDGSTQLDRELAQISTTSKVDDELAALKAEIGPGDTAKQLEQ